MRRTVILFLSLTHLALGGDKSPITHYEDGVYHEHVTKDTDKAILAYRRTLAHPTVSEKLKNEAALNLVSVLIKAKKTKEASDLLATLVTDQPDVVVGALNRARSGGTHGDGSHAAMRAELIERRLRATIIPRIIFTNKTVTEVFKGLATLSKKHGPDGKGVDITVFLHPLSQKTTPPEKRLDVDFSDLPLSVAIDYVCQMAGTKKVVDGKGVTILGKGLTNQPLKTRTFIVDGPYVFSVFKPRHKKAAGGEAMKDLEDKLIVEKKFPQPFSIEIGDDNDDASDEEKSAAALGLMEMLGVSFPKTLDGDSASLVYESKGHRLIVRTTEEDLGHLAELLDALDREGPNIELAFDMVEVFVDDEILNRVRPKDMAKFFSKLPKEKRRDLASTSINAVPGDEVNRTTTGATSWGKGIGYAKDILTCTASINPRVRVVSLDMSWRWEVWKSVQDYKKALEPTVQGKHSSAPIWGTEFRSDMHLDDNVTYFAKLAPNDKKAGRGALYCLIRARIVDAKASRAAGTAPAGGWLDIDAIPNPKAE